MCVQGPPKSRTAVPVNEARLALLLQAVRTSLQLQCSGHSFRLAAFEITAQLARCQVIGLLWSIRRFTAMALHQPLQSKATCSFLRLCPAGVLPNYIPARCTPHTVESRASAVSKGIAAQQLKPAYMPVGPMQNSDWQAATLTGKLTL